MKFKIVSKVIIDIIYKSEKLTSNYFILSLFFFSFAGQIVIPREFNLYIKLFWNAFFIQNQEKNRNRPKFDGQIDAQPPPIF